MSVLAGLAGYGDDEASDLEAGPPFDSQEPAAGPALPSDDYEAPPPEDDEADRLEADIRDTPAGEALDLCACAPEALLRAVRLPAPPALACSAELQSKLSRLLSLVQSGHPPVAAQLRQQRAYANPDFMTRAVDHFGIVESASALPTDIFDPAELAAEDFADALGAATRAQAEAREAERQKRGSIAFETARAR